MMKIKNGRYSYEAESIVDGVLVNPVLPKNFESTANESRPASHRKFFDLPFIVTESVGQLDAYYAGRTDAYAEEGRQHWVEGRANWMEAYPNGTCYEVRCLDGGAWDRSTWWGAFATLPEAIHCALHGPVRRQASPSRAEAKGDRALSVVVQVPIQT